MAIQSIDNLIAAISAGQKSYIAWNKITGASAYTAGRWYDTSLLAGHPVANAWAGSALAWTACDESTGNGTQTFGMRHGGDVSTDIKHIIAASAWSAAATSVPGTFLLVDLNGYWPGISVNSSGSQALTGTPTLRGAGHRLYGVITTASSTTAHNLSISYTDQDSNTGQTMPVTVACTTSAIVGHITHSGVAANNYGPFLPLANGDSGVLNVASVQFSAASGAGTMALCLARPICEITIGVAGLKTEKDFVNQIPSMPVIGDDACLVWLYAAGAATAASTTFSGSCEFVWG